MDELIPVRPNNPYPLGRAGVHHDPRNKQHRALVNPPPRRTRAVGYWFTRDVYDQGSESSCTAQSAVGLLRTSPFRYSYKEVAQYDDPQERYLLYKEAQKHDPWPGEDYEGSSSDAPFKVLRNRGVISAWKWLFGEEEVREYVQYYGPVGVGTLWTMDMFYPDSQGYVHPTGVSAGGHAYRLVQYSFKRDAYRIVNSWGKGWGQNGRAWITSEELASLLSDWGEAVTIAA